MTNQPPTISVNMAVYNAERHLSVAIESILNQTFTDFEFLIIDDGSTDRSLKILETYAQQDHRIRVTSRGNRGIAKTRNELLRQSQGEFIAVMDADDVAALERFALQVEFLRTHPKVICLGGDYDMIDSQGNLLYSITVPKHNDEESLLTGSTVIRHPSAMICRATLLQVGGYDETLKAAIDLDLWLRLGEVGELANLDHMLLKYRVHSNSVSERITSRQSHDARNACERAWQRRGIQGTYQAPNSWRHRFLLGQGRQLFANRQRIAAIAYGIRAVKALPFNIDGWKLLIGSIIKPLPH